MTAPLRFALAAALLVACGGGSSSAPTVLAGDGGADALAGDAAVEAPLRVRWTRVATDGPPFRGQPQLASFGAQVVLFGGSETNTSFRNDTWIWDGAAWRQITPATSPPGRGNGVMREIGGKLVLFGGVGRPPGGSIGAMGDLGAFDGTTWTELASTGAPPARQSAASAIVSGAMMIVFGGLGGGLDYLEDTWSFDGSAWTAIGAPGPSGRRNAAMASVAGVGVLAGGTRGAGGPRADVWRFEGGAWTEAGALAKVRSYHAAGAIGDRLVVFGGYHSAKDPVADTEAWPGPIEVVGPEPDAGAGWTMTNVAPDEALMWGAATPTPGAPAETWVLSRAD